MSSKKQIHHHGPFELVGSISTGTYERDDISKCPHFSLNLSF
jgi:hypothetical protein